MMITKNRFWMDGEGLSQRRKYKYIKLTGNDY
jgi:hypothetical protein